MNSSVARVIDVFPVTTAAFGFPENWFERYTTRLTEPSFLVMVFMIVLAIGIMTIKRFEDSDIESKLWGIPILILAVTFWPLLVLGLKGLVDTFNTFLIRDVFQIDWQGFSFPQPQSAFDVPGWSAEALVRLAPNVAYWVIYAFFIVMFFFFASLGPFLLAKGILFDEVGTLLDLIKEIIVLFLWQTTVVILVAFIMPEVVNTKALPSRLDANYYFLSAILAVTIFFAPTLTRKFASQAGAGPTPHGVRLKNIVLGMTAAGWVGSRGMAVAGFHPPEQMRSVYHEMRHWSLMPLEISQRRRAEERIESLEADNHHKAAEMERLKEEAEALQQEEEDMLGLMRKAKSEMEGEHEKREEGEKE